MGGSLNIENYRRFLEAVGHRVIASPSGYWFDISRSFYEIIPPLQLVAPDRPEINALFRQHRMIGLKYCAPHDHVGRLSWNYICRDKDYNLKSIHPKMRNKVRQGSRSCTIRPITFEFLHDHGMPLNRDTLKRQGRDDPTFSQPAHWARLCQAGQRTEGASAWGAFVGDQLAAYMITFVTGGYSNILYQMSRTDLLPSHANNALAFLATREMLASPGIQGVSYGHASIRELRGGLEEYKVRLGYDKSPMRYVVVFHPLLNPILLSRAGDALLRSMNRLLPNHDVMKRINGILRIVRHSQDSDSSRVSKGLKVR